jgi:hypothetical protein
MTLDDLTRTLRKPALIGVAVGTTYGVTARVAALSTILGGIYGVMTVSFLFLVPVVIGYLTVFPVSRPSWTFRLLAPWVPVTLSVLVAWLVGWEGAICIVMGFPLLLILSSAGGMLGASVARRLRPAVVALVPFLLGPLERALPVPVSHRRVETAIRISAPPAPVWAQIIEVPAIGPEEQRSALFTRMGFPRPISATLSRPGVGGIRMARFEGGVLFVETITDWDPERLLRFSIRPETDSIPATTLDRHVVVGGPYFDVLTGTYRIEPLARGGVILHLSSELRVTTPFNFYSGPWADAIMRSIQANILEVVRQRAERAADAVSR